MSCEKCRSNEHHAFRREYSRDAKQMGRAMYNMLLNGPLDKSQAVLTVQETRDACSVLWSRRTSGRWCFPASRTSLMTKMTFRTNPRSAK